jgi:hypothetical protein
VVRRRGAWTTHAQGPCRADAPPRAPGCRAEGDQLSKKAGDLEASLRRLRQGHTQLEGERERLSSRVKLLEVQLLEAQDTAASTGQHAAAQVRGPAPPARAWWLLGHGLWGLALEAQLLQAVELEAQGAPWTASQIQQPPPLLALQQQQQGGPLGRPPEPQPSRPPLPGHMQPPAAGHSRHVQVDELEAALKQAQLEAKRAAQEAQRAIQDALAKAGRWGPHPAPPPAMRRQPGGACDPAGGARLLQGLLAVAARAGWRSPGAQGGANCRRRRASRRPAPTPSCWPPPRSARRR